MAYETIFVDDQSDCLCTAAPAEHATSDHEAVNDETGKQVIDIREGDASVVEQGVVVHGPTIVVDAAPAQPAPAAAQPMPIAATGPSVLLKPTPAEEPIPDLKPAIAPQSTVAPASNEQPMPEPAAGLEKPGLEKPGLEKPGLEKPGLEKPGLEKPGLEKPAEVDQPVAPAAPMPAAVEDLAGGPEVKPPRQEPKEPNLFDLYGDDTDDEAAPSEEPPADNRPDTADDDAGEPAEDAAAETTPAAEAEMTEDDAEATESETSEAKATEAEATDGDSKTAEEAAPAEEPAAEEAAEEADAAPEAAAEQAEADPAEAAVTVPDEPMRRWTNDAGTHHTQGWLVEVQADQVRILKVNGRHTTVLTESLSAADRDYVSAVGDRLAAEQKGTSPAPSTTAGL
jgi:nicotinate-nucleotide--dimethylbenzimidazole phosphoribosyltransferase